MHFYSHHYAPAHQRDVQDLHRREFHHEELEWPGHDQHWAQDLHAADDHHPVDIHSHIVLPEEHDLAYGLSHAYGESHEQREEREFFERAHSIPQREHKSPHYDSPIQHPTPASLLLHDTLHAVSHPHHPHHMEEHHEVHHQDVHPSDFGVIYPGEEHDFVKYTDQHHVTDQPGNPHGKIYDKHYRTYYHEQTPLIPGSEHGHDWKGDFTHDIKYDVDLYHERARGKRHDYWDDHYTDAHDIDHFSGDHHEDERAHFQGDDDEKFHVDMTHFESPHHHMLGEYDHSHGEHEKRPGDHDFETFDWAQYQADEESERLRKKQLKMLVEKERQREIKYEHDLEEKKRIEEEKKKKADEDAHIQAEIDA